MCKMAALSRGKRIIGVLYPLTVEQFLILLFLKYIPEPNRYSDILVVIGMIC